MLRITKSMSAKAGASYYDNGLKRSDYYVKETGFWVMAGGMPTAR